MRAELQEAPRKPFEPSVLTPGLVRPMGVFVAGRKRFEVATFCEVEPDHALALIFSRLPLEENGWRMQTTMIRRVKRTEHGFPVWSVERQ